MKFDAKISRTFPSGNVKAIADVTIDDAIAVHGVKVIEGKNGLFVSMPSEKWQDKDGNFKHTDIVHPVTSDIRHEFDEAVKGAYQCHLHSQSSSTQNAGISM